MCFKRVFENNTQIVAVCNNIISIYLPIIVTTRKPENTVTHSRVILQTIHS